MLEVTSLLDFIKIKNANESEFIQAVEEFSEVIIPFIKNKP